MTHQTLYVRATEEMNELVRILLDLSEKTAGFTNPPDEIWAEDEATRLLLGGLGYHSVPIAQTEERRVAWLSRSALVFSVELAATAILYERLQPYIEEMIETAYRDTDNFRSVTSEWVQANPHLLPVIMHAVGTFSQL